MNKNLEMAKKDLSLASLGASPKRAHKLPTKGPNDSLEDQDVDDQRSPFQDPENKELNKEERAFKKGLSRLLTATHAYVESGRQFAKATATLGAELQELSSLEWMVSQQASKHVSHIGNLMRSLSAIQEKTVNSVQDACDVPMFQLMDVELNEMRHLADMRSKAEEAASRHKKRGAEKFVGEGAAMEKSADQARNELEAQIAVLDGAKKIKLFRFLRSLVASEEEFYMLGNHGMSELAPHTVKLDAQLAELEATYGKRCRDGYVWKLSHKMGKWKRVWLVLRNGSLEVRSDGKKMEGRAKEGRKMNLLISTVRVPVVPRASGADDFGGSGEKFEFEIVTPERRRGWMFATRSDSERQEWIEALQASIGSLINNQQLGDGGDGDGPMLPVRKSAAGRDKTSTATIGMSIIRKVIPGGKGHRKSRSVTSAETARMMAMSLMQEGSESSVLAELAAVPGNDVCVDCGKSDPDWASMNLGVLFCLNCSGVHRHLGSHISKVRSLTMDKWPEGTLRYMRSVGNKKANSFWEARLDADSPVRVKPTSTQQERTEFITQKYERKRYAIECPLSTRAEVNAALFRTLTDLELMAPIPSSAVNTPTMRRTTPDAEVSGIQRSSSSSAVVVSPPATAAPDHPPVILAPGGVSTIHDLGRTDSASPMFPPIVNGGPPVLLSPERLQEVIWPLYELLAWGAELSALHPTTGRSLGQVLLEKKDPWLMHLFVVHGVEVAQVDEATGESLLHFAARYNLAECLEVVFTHLGSLTAQVLHGKNVSGDMPMDVARAHVSLRVLEVLAQKEEKLREKAASSPMRGGSEGLGGDGPVQDEHSPTHGGAEESSNGQRSPRGRLGNSLAEMGSQSKDEESGMQKFLKKATGGHMRSKSVFQAPSSGGAAPRELGSTPKLGTLSKILRNKDGKGARGPNLSSRATAGSPIDNLEASHEEDESFNGTPSATPLRNTVGHTVTLEEVPLRGKKLMKGGKGLDQRAIREALIVSDDLARAQGGSHAGSSSGGSATPAPVRSDSGSSLGGATSAAQREERDLMGFISTESSDE